MHGQLVPADHAPTPPLGDVWALAFPRLLEPAHLNALGDDPDDDRGRVDTDRDPADNRLSERRGEDHGREQSSPTDEEEYPQRSRIRRDFGFRMQVRRYLQLRKPRPPRQDEQQDHAERDRVKGAFIAINGLTS